MTEMQSAQNKDDEKKPNEIFLTCILGLASQICGM